MKYYSKPLIIGLLFIAGLTACKKDAASIEATTNNLVGSYKLTAMTAKSGSYPEASVYNQLVKECQKDDIYKLNADFSVVYTDAGAKCDVPGDFTSVWSLTTNNTKIIIDGLEGLIEKFDGTVLMVSSEDSSSGTKVTFTATYTRQ